MIPMLLVLQIFWIFFRFSLISFGGVFGVLPQLERMLVVEHGWITHDQFIHSYVMAQFVPGPNMVMCPLIGYRIAGWAGFVSAFLGIYIAPLLIMGAAFVLYAKYRELHVVKKVELGLRPLVIGLLSASAANLWWTQSHVLIESHLPLSMTLAALLVIVGFYLVYFRKFDATKLIFASGAFTWFVHFAVTASPLNPALR